MEAGRGDFDRAVELMLPVRSRLKRIGGSHAQRDVFQQLFITAAIKGGRLRLARETLSERLAHRPENQWAQHWSSMLGNSPMEQASATMAM